MKRIFTILVLFVFIASAINAQKLVSTEVEKKNVVLEEFTGINCTFCPDGHRIANAMVAEDPDNVVVVNIHAGSFAVPGPGQPDFRTSFGEALDDEIGVSGYPSGAVNRSPFNNSLDINRGMWATAADLIKTQTSPVNLGVSSEFDASTRELKVNVELYYTDNSPESSNFIQVAFLENGFLGFQIDAGVEVSNYEHNKILRHLITGQWGDEVNETTTESFVEREYTWIVPAEYDINDCDIVAYVTESRREVYTGHKVIADGGTTESIGTVASESSVDYFAGEANAIKLENITLENTKSTADIYDVVLVSEGPSDWSGEILINGMSVGENATIAIDADATENIGISVTPGNSAGIGIYKMEVTSQNLPGAPSLKKSINIISGVNDLIISNTAAAEYANFYSESLAFAENDANYTALVSTFLGFQNANALDDVLNIYYNVGWTFPGLNNAVVDALRPFMDNGGNLFIAGQDIGWDAFQNMNTANVQSFYNDYINATFVNDGSSATNTVTANSEDEIFQFVGSSAIIDIYGGNNVYPEQVNPRNGSLPIFTYNGNQTGGLRSDNGVSKVVYLGFNFEQLSDKEVARRIAKTTHDWFYGIISDVFDIELDKNIAAYPNPTTDKLYIDVDLDENSKTKVSILDNMGKVVLSKNYGSLNGPNTLELDTDNLASGLYLVRVSLGDSFATKKITITK